MIPQTLEPTKPITLLMTMPVVNLKGELWRALWKIVHPGRSAKAGDRQLVHATQGDVLAVVHVEMSRRAHSHRSQPLGATYRRCAGKQ